MNFQQQLQRFPAISDLQARARSRIPHVSWEYLSGGTGEDDGRRRNRDGLARITLRPRFLKGPLEPDTSTTLFGQRYEAPFGVAPVGLTGLIWPRAEQILAQTARKYSFPYTLSTVATQTPETIGPLAGEMGWFQLYPPRRKEIRADLLQRVRDAGFRTLVLTVDIPAPSRRERMSRAGLEMPPRLTPRFIAQAAVCPEWTYETLREGLPSLKGLHKYAGTMQMAGLSEFVRQHIGGTLSWQYMAEVRELWAGPLVIKGILHPADAVEAIRLGADGIQVSNHGGRQFDGNPAAIDTLPPIVEAVKGRAAVIFDSGVRSGLDIIRALALGADFVMLGRAFMFGVAAFGRTGGDHAAEILLADLKTNMHQLGVDSIAAVKALETGRDGS